MSQVSLVIYGLAALWATQTLLQLMVQHRRATLSRLQVTEIQRLTTEVPGTTPAASVTIQPPARKETTASPAGKR